MAHRLLSLACVLGAAALVGAKLWAGLTGDLSATMAAAGDDPWGIVALIGLYLGLAGFAVALWRGEPNRWIALAVLAATPLVGNAAPALWLAWRGLPRLRRPSGHG